MGDPANPLETMMMKSLFAGAVALAVIAVAALAGEAYSGDATAPVIPPAPARSSPATSTLATSTSATSTSASVSLAASVDPRVFDPTRIVTSHARRAAPQGGQTTDQTVTAGTTRTVTRAQD
jgi:hypothetical protein